MNPQRTQAYQRAFDNVDTAALAHHLREQGRADDDYQRLRYAYLRDDPAQLERFVAEALKTDNPAQIQNGTRDYLAEMEKRYGTAQT